jgi:two-component system, cell cycle sensor histidine kinase and response regulator CckA
VLSPLPHERQLDFHRQFVEALPHVVWIARTDGAVEHLNRAGRQLLGRSGAPTDHWIWITAVHPDDQPAAAAAWAEAVRANTAFEFDARLERADGVSRRFRLNGTPLRGPDGTAEWWAVTCTESLVRDREAEPTGARDARFERRYRSLVAALYQLVAVTDPQSRALEISDFANVLDPAEQPSVEGWFARIHPDDRNRITALWTDALATGRTIEAEYRFLRHDGEWRQVASRMVAVRDRTGRIEEWVAVVDDVTDRRRAEAELLRSERRYRSLVSASAQIVWTAAATGENVIVHGAEAFFGVADGPVPLDVWLDRIHPDDRDRVLEAWAKGQKFERPYHVEFRLRRTDGKWRQMLGRTVPVRDEAGRLEEWIGVVDDVTEEQRLAEQVRQAQKMEAIGRLAGGVAHDFNNLLTVINGYSELVLSELAPDHPARSPIAVIRDAGERASGLTQQLLSFSRKQVLEPKVLDLNEVVSHADKLLRRLIGEDLSLGTVLDPNVPRVKVDPGQLEQVILNLAVNARDAMPTGGRLTIETGSQVVTEDEAANDPEVRPGCYARLAVTDTGHGMTDDVKAQLFEPFFTTKEAGKGTGLGLAVVHGVVKQSGGHIGVYSEVGLGTTFRILLPAVDAVPARLSAHALVVPGRGSETVLIAEDEGGVRRMARVALEAHGYTVLTASNGREAAEVAAKHNGPIHLLLTDVVMPEVGGRELAERLKARIGGLRVLFMSGYTDDAVVRHGVLEATSAFLHKPFTPLSLAKKIREMLDARG